MASTISFTNAVIRGFSFSPGPKRGQGSANVSIEVSAAWTEKVAKAMNWADVPESIIGAPKLRGELAAQTMTVTPGDKELEQYRLELGISSVEDFNVFLPESKDDKPRSRELRFTVITPVDGAEGVIGQYGRRIGQKPGTIRISYHKQEELALEARHDRIDKHLPGLPPQEDSDESDEVDRGCVACNNDIPLNEPFDGRHESGADCTNPDNQTGKEAPLASARAAVGGTHQARRPGRPRRAADAPTESQEGVEGFVAFPTAN